eukprot:CAMPEP_0197850990 /NCGR_PEP_ID=MMETSP1438-20131217/16947_1 /TAXON_ID=1461541 /ORGANISM="Pterosperma sp., Strain CCMP1384" /LENGTH=441 /DNA_ID=CAMNT_0043464439 /DNA_START=71 /DNA_END=1396 /DNA_ORIENTATION=+
MNCAISSSTIISSGIALKSSNSLKELHAKICSRSLPLTHCKRKPAVTTALQQKQISLSYGGRGGVRSGGSTRSRSLQIASTLASEGEVADTIQESDVTAVSPLIELGDEDQGRSRRAAASAFERVDDVVMGGVSSSKLVAARQRSCLVWSGKCRVDGGGFTGTRTKALASAVDLSKYNGLVLRCALESDDEPERRTWKVTLRTQNNRGEIVYQAAFTPPVAIPDTAPPPIHIPWNKFRLVRGPAVMEGVPPLSADQCKSVYGLGLIMSRFGAQGPMTNFKSGAFRLAIHGLGCYSTSPEGDQLPPVDMLPPLTESSATTANRGTRTILTFILAPILAIVFNEQSRRRKQARALLKKMFGFGPLRARAFGQKLKRQRMSGLKALVQGMVELTADAITTVLSLPVRLLFIAASFVGKFLRFVKGKKPLPSMKAAVKPEPKPAT